MSANPLKAVLDCIPYTSTVLSLELADSIRGCFGDDLKHVTNEYIMLLVTYLAQMDLIELSELKPLGHLGTIYFVKKV